MLKVIGERMRSRRERRRGGRAEAVNVGDSKRPIAESASSCRSCWTTGVGAGDASVPVLITPVAVPPTLPLALISVSSVPEPAPDTPATSSTGKRSVILIIGGSPSVSPSSSVVAGRSSSARCEIPERVVFEADDALRVFERPRDANQLAVLGEEVESGVERGALGPNVLGCGSDDPEFVGRTDTGDESDDVDVDADEEEDGEAVRPASIPTLSSALRLGGAPFLQRRRP